MSEYSRALDLLVDKVEGDSSLDWGELTEKIGLDVHPDSLRKAFTVTPFCGYGIYKYFADLEERGLSVSDAEGIERKRQGLYKERVKLQDVKREYNAKLREEARFESLLEVLQNEIKALPELELGICHYADKSSTEAALLLSDLHYGIVVDNVLNYYDKKVCREKLKVLFNKTVHYCTLHRVKTLYINLGGDLVSGLIQVGSRCEQEQDVVSQTIEISEIICKFIAKLTEYISEVKVVCVQGNHSRCSAEIKQSLNAENFERFIFEYLKNRLPKISVITNGLEDWVAYEIKGHKIFLEHGDKTKIETVKDKAVNLLGYAPDDIFLGHWHSMKVIDQNGTDVVVNGSVLGTDGYAMRRRFNSQPCQVLRVYGDDVLTYKILLP